MLVSAYVCGKHKALLTSALVVEPSEGVEQTLSSDTPIHHSEAGSSLKKAHAASSVAPEPQPDFFAKQTGSKSDLTTCCYRSAVTNNNNINHNK